MLRDRGQEDVEVLLALTASDQLTGTLGPDDVHGEHARRIVRRLLHVEGLHRLGVVRDDQRLVVLGGEELLVGRAEVVALDELDVGVLEEELRCIVVGDAREATFTASSFEMSRSSTSNSVRRRSSTSPTTDTIMSSASWITSSSSA